MTAATYSSIQHRSKQQNQQQPLQQQRRQEQVLAAHAEPLERGKNLKELIKANKQAEKSRKGYVILQLAFPLLIRTNKEIGERLITLVVLAQAARSTGFN